MNDPGSDTPPFAAAIEEEFGDADWRSIIRTVNSTRNPAPLLSRAAPLSPPPRKLCAGPPTAGPEMTALAATAAVTSNRTFPRERSCRWSSAVASGPALGSVVTHRDLGQRCTGQIHVTGPRAIRSRARSGSPRGCGRERPASRPTANSASSPRASYPPRKSVRRLMKHEETARVLAALAQAPARLASDGSRSAPGSPSARWGCRLDWFEHRRPDRPAGSSRNSRLLSDDLNDPFPACSGDKQTLSHPATHITSNEERTCTATPDVSARTRARIPSAGDAVMRPPGRPRHDPFGPAGRPPGGGPGEGLGIRHGRRSPHTAAGGRRHGGAPAR